MKKLRITIQERLNEIDYTLRLDNNDIESLDTMFKSTFPDYKLLYNEYGSDVVDKIFEEEFNKWERSNYLIFIK